MVIFLTFDFENKYVEFMFVVVLTVSGVKIAIHCTVCVFKEKKYKIKIVMRHINRERISQGFNSNDHLKNI